MSRQPHNQSKKAESYDHTESTRLNNPTQESEKFLSELDRESIEYEPDLREAEAPRLAWKRTKPDAPTRKAGPLYIHEKIDPSVFLEQLEGGSSQLSLDFSLFSDLPSDAQFECYRHSGDWSNRLIHGNSAQIMASLAAKENLQGKIQMIYFDPPYGISFNSNMQLRTDTITPPPSEKAKISAEPEMVRAFRDTYKNGIHDYLDGIRENVILARNLLSESGSLFLQIGAKNVHRIAIVLDEIFGTDNRIATITFRKTGISSSNNLAEVADYLLWYCKDKQNIKFQNLYFQPKSSAELLESMSSYAMVELEDGSVRNLYPEERRDPDSIPKTCRLFKRVQLMSQHHSTTGRSEPFEWDGNVFHCKSNRQWSVSHEGLQKLAEKKRLVTASGADQLQWKQYASEIPGTALNNVWDKTLKANDLHYVVETAEKVVERCILMTTEPGDLVLDITCGSGTTPFVAEKWGRRWIATDASRVPIALTRQRILSAVYDWYVLQNSPEGQKLEFQYDPKNSRIASSGISETKDPSYGFVYKRISKVSPAILAYDKPPEFHFLVDDPHLSRGKKRIASAFTVESHSPYRMVTPENYLSEDMSWESQEDIVEALRKAGIRMRDGSRYIVQDIEKVSYQDHAHLSHLCNIRLDSSEHTDIEPVALSILPDDASCSQGWISQALRTTAALRGPKKVIVLAFNFDSDALVDTPIELGDVSAVCLRSNRDLMISNLEHSNFDSAFVQIGEPDVVIREEGNNQFSVEVVGFDTFDPKSGNLTSGEAKEIDCWMLDTNYDQTAFMARRVHFPNGKDEKQLKRYKTALKSVIDDDQWEQMLSTKSSPFDKPKTGRIAVRIITTTAIEMTTVRTIE